MKDFINTLYRNNGLIYKGLLFIFTSFFIVYLFPKSAKFKYSFEKGKPWQSENLYAPFDFAIQKSEDEITAEKTRITTNSVLYFDVDTLVVNKVTKLYEQGFYNAFPDSINRKETEKLYRVGQNIISLLYDYGILSENYNFAESKAVALLSNRIKIKEGKFSNLVKQEQVTTIIENSLVKHDLLLYTTNYRALFFDLIEPNLVYDKSFTSKALDGALNKISFARGRIAKETLIVSKGEVVEGDTYLILKSLQSEFESQIWSRTNYNWIIFAYTILVALALLMLLLFLQKYRKEVFDDNTKVTFIFFNILLIIFLTTLVVKYNAKFIYVVPICILPLVFKAFFDARLGLFAHVITVLLLGFVVPNSYEYMFLQIIAGIVTILTVSELYKRANLFISVGQITLIYIIAYFAFIVIHDGSPENIKWETFIWFVLSGLATLFVQPLIYAYEKLFGLVSDVSLLELSDTNSRLLKEFSNKAPGTFHHSLSVANLAEASANEIGANAMLVRVGALYHDIGKMKNPTFFTENQISGVNPHDEMYPTESANIIINHVIDGIEIAKKNNLPDRIIDFIRTHHGTSVVYFFYMKEKKNFPDTDKETFSYPGPTPFSKETAILMMCDSVEAASKSLKEPTSGKIDTFVERIIDKQIEDGQFLNANITFKEIQAIKKVLKLKLSNIYHLRIEYPE